MVVLWLAVFCYLKDPVLRCDSVPLDGPLLLVVSDLHVHQHLVALDYLMRKAVRAARRAFPAAQQTVVLGDVMHWAGGLTNANLNLTAAQWSEALRRAQWIVDDPAALYVPGNHDLNDTVTQRWVQAFGAYDRDVMLLGNVSARLASSMAPKPHGAPVLLSHYPLRSAQDVLWHPQLQLSLNGHMHWIEYRAFNGTRQVTLPTLNPWQAFSNNHLDGSGQQGLAVMDRQLRVRMCRVSTF